MRAVFWISVVIEVVLGVALIAIAVDAWIYFWGTGILVSLIVAVILTSVIQAMLEGWREL